MAVDKKYLQCTFHLDRIIAQRREAVFEVRNKKTGEHLGKLSLFYRKVIDKSKGQGSEGTITRPPPHYFPERIILDQPKNY